MCTKKMIGTIFAVLLGFANTLTIDNQLSVIRNDCYERLALGQKLSPQDVDKELEADTVQECQMACTQAGEKCRSFSFGVGVKGNATCSLSRSVVKETTDLKPIGTITDIDYDLYIKKIGCKLVLNHDQTGTKPSNNIQHNTSDTPSYQPLHPQKPYRVQSSFISVASGPPQAPQPPRYGTGKPHLSYNDYASDRPPFRPPYLNHPYDDRYSNRKYAAEYFPYSNDRLDFDPRPQKIDDYLGRPQRPDFIPSRPRPSVDSYAEPHPHRPHKIPERPLDDGYNSAAKPHRPIKIPERPNDYDFKPQRPDFIPDRPNHNVDFGGYTDFHPHRPHKIPARPLNDGYRPDNNQQRPDFIPDRPLDQSRPTADFDNYSGQRPHRPPKIPERPWNDGYGSETKPYRPHNVPERPDDYTEYKPHRPDYIPNQPELYESSGLRPHRPQYTPISRPGYGPRPISDVGDDPQPHRPSHHDYKPEHYRPGGIKPGSYGSRPHHPNYIPEAPSDYGTRPHRPSIIPERPLINNRPKPIDSFDGYHEFGPQRPVDIPSRPDGYGSRPHRPEFSDPYLYEPKPIRPLRPIKDGGYGGRPHRPDGIPERPDNYINDVNDYGEYESYRPYRKRPYADFDGYGPKDVQQKPFRPADFGYDFDPNFERPFYVPPRPMNLYEKDKNDAHNSTDSNTTTVNSGGGQVNMTSNIGDGKYRPVITQSRGPYGDTITSILTPLRDTCFRRVLAGKRVLRSFVRKAVPCERVEDCQRECSDERRFVCEGFNYRLDPTGRGQGDCELIDVPLSRLDIRRDVTTDTEYDYYERDRNSDGPDCKGTRYYGSYSNRREDDYDYHRRGDYYDHYFYDDDDDDRYNYRYRQPRPDTYNDYRYNYNRRGGKNYGHGSEEDGSYYKSDKPPYDYKSYEPYLPYPKHHHGFYDTDKYWNNYYEDRIKDKNYWGFKEQNDGWGSYGGAYGNFGKPDSYFHYDYDNHHRNNHSHKKYYLVPYEDGESNDWGRYGGTYGYGGRDNHKTNYNYWGFNKFDSSNELLPPYQSKPEYNKFDSSNELLPPYQTKPEYIGSYLPPYEKGTDYFGLQHGYRDSGYDYGYDHNYVKDQCSLRMTTGFRLHKGILKKIISAENIYECELLCSREKDFHCSSYSFRYTLVNNVPRENCYLSDRTYKELDYYSDLEPDRDFDIYTINNRDRCSQPVSHTQENSDCFWRVRSGQRLDHKVVRDSLNVKSIVNCQLECLRAHSFTCRAFSYRYGSPIIGGAIDNCQLTDWPVFDLNPRVDFIPEVGYEIYERRSYGHGCEPTHFEINHRPTSPPQDKMDQVCYVGYGTPAKLLPQATKKSIWVTSEAECKAECTQAREKGLFQCMSFSYRLRAPKGTSNCDLSDILQRDLLSNVDYVADPDSWLFAWDLHNPRCVSVIVIGSTILGGESHDHHKEDGAVVPWHSSGRPEDTWKLYSVRGLPCKRGSLCQENKVAGFWYCELEGREEHAWDYCCSPDHQCGYTDGFPYQWCYVGERKTQWRKCNDKYYPYGTVTDRYDHHYLPDTSSNHLSPPSRPSFRPDRPPPPDDHFLDPPKPGGFGHSRHWPISYLHKELPQNDSLPEIDSNFDFQKLPKARNIDNKYEAIGNVIKAIKSNELKISQPVNTSDQVSDSLHVKIPIPAESDKNAKEVDKFETVDLIVPRGNDTNATWDNQKATERSGRVYTRSYITKTTRSAANEPYQRVNLKVSI